MGILVESFNILLIRNMVIIIIIISRVEHKSGIL